MKDCKNTMFIALAFASLFVLGMASSPEKMNHTMGRVNANLRAHRNAAGKKAATEASAAKDSATDATRTKEKANAAAEAEAVESSAAVSSSPWPSTAQPADGDSAGAEKTSQEPVTKAAAAAAIQEPASVLQEEQEDYKATHSFDQQPSPKALAVFTAAALAAGAPGVVAQPAQRHLGNNGIYKPNANMAGQNPLQSTGRHGIDTRGNRLDLLSPAPASDTWWNPLRTAAPAAGTSRAQAEIELARVKLRQGELQAATELARADQKIAEKKYTIADRAIGDAMFLDYDESAAARQDHLRLVQKMRNGASAAEKHSNTLKGEIRKLEEEVPELEEDRANAEQKLAGAKEAQSEAQKGEFDEAEVPELAAVKQDLQTLNKETEAALKLKKKEASDLTPNIVQKFGHYAKRAGQLIGTFTPRL